MKTIRSIALIPLLTVLVACGSSESPSKTETVTGTFIDEPVSGLSYQCSSGSSGTTNTKGEYSCQLGDTVTFSLGGVDIGSTTAKIDFITPYSLFPNKPLAALNLARLLQSSDTDGSASDGVITLNQTSNLPAGLDFSSPTFDADVGITLISAENAQKHLHDNIVSNGGTIPENAVNALDTTAPVITITGDNPFSVFQGSVYNDAGATASDNVDTSVAVSTTGTVNTTVIGVYTLTYIAIDNASNTATATRTVHVTAAPDTSGPSAPTLLSTLTATNQDTYSVEISGESNATVWHDATSAGTSAENGTVTLTLNTSGDDGIKSFSITLKDAANNESAALLILITKDTVMPNTNAKMTSLQTADFTPALSGNLPSGDDDLDTTAYSVTVEVNGVFYPATNNQDGTWSIAAGTLTSLAEGFYSVNVLTTDAAGNSSTTTLTNQLEINNSGFLIDSALEGIKYVAGQYSGYTDKNGLFKYEKDQDITFYIGDETTGVVLGTGQIKRDPYADRNIITLFDLAGSQDENNQKVINRGRLLQSLDSDNDTSNGILIDERTKESIALLGLRNRIDFDNSVEQFAANNDIDTLFNDLAGHFGEHRGLIAAEDVKAHLVSVRDNTSSTRSYGLDTSGGKKQTTVIGTGTFKSTTGIVEGLDYRSGNQSGRTNDKGEYSYEEGAKVKFFIYELALGTTESKAVITPADLVPSTSFNHPKPRNIIRLLNAFDAVSDDAKISIDQAVRNSLEKYRSQIDLNLPDGKANEDLGIAKGNDEFGAQFEDFEMGKEILDEVSRLRAED